MDGGFDSGSTDLNIDMGAALAEMSDGMASGDQRERSDAGSSDESGSANQATGGSGQDAPRVVATVATTLNDPYTEHPKSWRAEMSAAYKGLDPTLRAYIHERERQALDGVMQYKTPLDEWQAAVNPFQAILESAKLKPQDVFRSFAAGHQTLAGSDDTAKLRYLNRIITDYRLSPELVQRAFGFAGTNTPANPQPTLPPEVLARLESAEQRSTRVEQFMQQQQEASSMAEVKAFAADTANEFVQDLFPDMIQALNAGTAKSLREAYDKAMWLNPGVRAKLIEREAGKLTNNGNRTNAPRNMRSSATEPAPTGTKGETMEDTLNNTMKAITARSS